MRELIQTYERSPIADNIEAVSQPCVIGYTCEDPVGLGESKVGGLPHGPDSFEWPYFYGPPLEFVVQIDCTETGSPHRPKEGMPLFFCDNHHAGYSIKERGFFRIIHGPVDPALQAIPPPTVRRPRLGGLLGHTVVPVQALWGRIEYGVPASWTSGDSSRRIARMRPSAGKEHANTAGAGTPRGRPRCTWPNTCRWLRGRSMGGDPGPSAACAPR